MAEYCPMMRFNELTSEIAELAHTKDLQVLQRNIEFLGKDLDKLVHKEEFKTRFQALNQDFNRKFNDRPTNTYIKKIMHAH